MSEDTKTDSTEVPTASSRRQKLESLLGRPLSFRQVPNHGVMVEYLSFNHSPLALCAATEDEAIEKLLQTLEARTPV